MSEPLWESIKSSLFLIAGPCVIETEANTRYIAQTVKAVGNILQIPVIFKASFDKANRSSWSSPRGPGLNAGIDILRNIKVDFEIPVTTDVHEPWHCDIVAPVADIIQIPALLSRQTDLIVAGAKTGKILNVKKGQFMSPWDIGAVISKVVSGGGQKIILTERGSCFGYNNLVVDMRSIPVMKRHGFPVVIDASHSVQRPSANKVPTTSSGDPEFIPVIASAGIASGANGLFVETHFDPPKAFSDKENSLPMKNLLGLASTLKRVWEAVRFAPI